MGFLRKGALLIMKLHTFYQLTSLTLLWLLTTTTYAGNSCVVLQYHHFSSSTPAITSVTPEQFDQHIDYLQKNDFKVLPLRDVITQLQNDIELPDKCVSLTVDDAYDSVYETAYPKLKQLGWPMTVFVNTRAVDENQKPYMSWQQMREMSQHGFSFENHGHSHGHLIRKLPGESDDDWEQRVAADILTAQNRISEELEIIPVFFAHPYGEYNPAILKLLKQFGLTGFGQQSGPVWPDADFGALPRFPMAAQYANLPGFKTKVNTLAMPVVNALPEDPLVASNTQRPEVIIQFAPGTFSKNNINCFINGSKNISMIWADNNTLLVSPNFDLPAGRSRTNCTMSSTQRGRFHWYSHNFIKRKADGSWYQEY